MSSLSLMEIVHLKSRHSEPEWGLCVEYESNHLIYHTDPICEVCLTLHCDLNFICNFNESIKRSAASENLCQEVPSPSLCTWVCIEEGGGVPPDRAENQTLLLNNIFANLPLEQPVSNRHVQIIYGVTHLTVYKHFAVVGQFQYMYHSLISSRFW